MVDIKCNFPKNKYNKQERPYNPRNQEDESVLRQPKRTFCAGFKEAKKAYENGTDEVRQLLMQECSLIYECNVCRNMFRNLSNFICHKRKYCTLKTANEVNYFPDEGRNKFAVKAIEQSNFFPVKSRSTDSSPVPTTANHDISRVIERFKRVEVSNVHNCNKNLSSNNRKTLYSSDPEALDTTLELESVVIATQGVYQTSKTHKDTDGIKIDLNDNKNILGNQNMLFGPYGKPSTSALAPFTSSTPNATKEQEKSICGSLSFHDISCKICKIQFNTEKRLKVHVEKMHTSTTYVFQCPTCTMSFLQPAAVIRHLANEHRKPLRRIRKMRDTILKKRIQIGNVQIKGMNRNVRSFQLNNTKSCSTSNQHNEEFISSCSYCSKIFHGRAALATHLMNCLGRNVSEEDLPKIVNQPKDEAQNQISNDQNERIFREDEVTLNVKQPQGAYEPINIKNSNTIDKMFENLENQTFGNGLHTVCLENMMDDLNESSIEGLEDVKESESKKNHNNFRRNDSGEKNMKVSDVLVRHKSTKRGNPKRFRVVSTSKQLTCRCKICNKQFNALSNLRRHISMFHYRSKRFGCNLCDYRAFRRYDIVNHLTFVHKMTGERESMAIEYVTVHEIKYSKNDIEGDIVLINEDAVANDCKRNKHQHLPEQSQMLAIDTAFEAFDNGDKNKKLILKSNKLSKLVHTKESIDVKVKSQVKVVRKKLKKSLETQVESKMRPIRNRIKTVNNDFVYDVLTVKEEPKQATRLTFKRSNMILNDQNNLQKVVLTPPPVKIIPYRLRTEPLMPADKSCVKGAAENICQNVVHGGLAAPSTLPELPTERPQMRSRLISASRSDINTIPVIESSELEAAGLKSTFFDDSFLERFAKKSNPSFKMKPLLAMQHSPLNSILQKFDASQQNLTKPTENFNICLLESLTLPNLKDTDVTSNNKQVVKQSSPPAAPKKRITLMERLAENRAKRRGSLIRTALDN